MTSSSAEYNRRIMNKMLWMSRQLRNFNDNVNIGNWVHAMSMLKSLLLPLSALDHQSLPEPLQSQAIISHPTKWSITPPTTISFLPAKKKPLIQSPPRCSNFEPQAVPLTTYTLCLPIIPPTDSLPQRPKRRKLSIPPSVDYSASTQVPLPTSTSPVAAQSKTSPGLDSHIWHLLDPKTSEHMWSRWKTPEAEEFKIVKAPIDFDSQYELLNVATGKVSFMKFSKDHAKFLFKT